MSIFKTAIFLSFPSALLPHYLIALLLWYKSQDLLVSALSLSAYFFGFMVGMIYVQRSPSSLTRVAGILLSANVVTTIALAGFGFGFLPVLLSAPLGVTLGGLLSLPLSRLMSPARSLLLAAFPLLGGFLMVAVGYDYPLIGSALISFIAATLLFASLKIVVPKPVLLPKISLAMPKEFAALAMLSSLGCSLGTLLTPIVAVVDYSISPLWVGLVITASLLVTSMIGRTIASQKFLQKSMAVTIGFSLVLVLAVLGISSNQYLFMILWLAALVDVSAYNTFIMAAVNTLKKCDANSFRTLSAAITPLGPILAILIWALGSYQSMFFFSALLILISILILRLLLKGDQSNAQSGVAPGP